MYFSKFFLNYAQVNDQLNIKLLLNNSNLKLFKQLIQISDSHTENHKTMLILGI